VFEIVESYYEHSAVRHICHAAVGRLPCRQREVVEFLFFQGGEPDGLAARRRIAMSTVYNHKAQALSSMQGFTDRRPSYDRYALDASVSADARLATAQV
jgi:DNA-directed RNA polymerase specialized sigma24 family protein